MRPKFSIGEILGDFENSTFSLKNAVATFWVTFGKIGLYF